MKMAYCDDTDALGAIDLLEDELKAARKRIKTLESHRKQWRDAAWLLGDAVRAGNFERARTIVAEWDEAMHKVKPSQSNSEDKS